MKKPTEILKTHKYAIIWTACYIAGTWAILYFMFNFSIFNASQWHRLAHAQLHGFGGFVFGILILAALPLYIATTTLIIRNKKPLITIPTPKIKLPALTQKAPAAEPQDPVNQQGDTETPNPQEEKLPEDLPAELHSAFLRAHNTIGHLEFTSQQPDTQTTAPEGIDPLPLPTDFDIQLNDIPGFDDTTDINTPIFTEINFDDDKETQTTQSNNTAGNNQDLIEHLNARKQTFSQIEDVIITKEQAIITHDDDDFWVTDDENWFAAGKTRPSPIATVTKIATEHNLTPVIYLASQNIMDLEQLIPLWQSQGITVITSPSEIQ